MLQPAVSTSLALKVSLSPSINQNLDSAYRSSPFINMHVPTVKTFPNLLLGETLLWETSPVFSFLAASNNKLFLLGVGWRSVVPNVEPAFSVLQIYYKDLIYPHWSFCFTWFIFWFLYSDLYFYYIYFIYIYFIILYLYFYILIFGLSLKKVVFIERIRQ